MLIPLPNYTLEIRSEDGYWYYGKEGEAKHKLPECNHLSPLGIVITEAFYQILICGDRNLTPCGNFVWERQRPYEPDKIRVECGDYHRASGNVTCEICGCNYSEHSKVTGYDWLNQLCDGTLVHL